jgi:hypothetical protein
MYVILASLAHHAGERDAPPAGRGALGRTPVPHGLGANPHGFGAHPGFGQVHVDGRCAHPW